MSSWFWALPSLRFFAFSGFLIFGCCLTIEASATTSRNINISCVELLGAKMTQFQVRPFSDKSPAYTMLTGHLIHNGRGLELTAKELEKPIIHLDLEEEITEITFSNNLRYVSLSTVWGGLLLFDLQPQPPVALMATEIEKIPPLPKGSVREAAVRQYGRRLAPFVNQSHLLFSTDSSEFVIIHSGEIWRWASLNERPMPQLTTKALAIGAEFNSQLLLAFNNDFKASYLLNQDSLRMLRSSSMTAIEDESGVAWIDSLSLMDLTPEEAAGILEVGPNAKILRRLELNKLKIRAANVQLLKTTAEFLSRAPVSVRSKQLLRQALEKRSFLVQPDPSLPFGDYQSFQLKFDEKEKTLSIVIGLPPGVMRSQLLTNLLLLRCYGRILAALELQGAGWKGEFIGIFADEMPLPLARVISVTWRPHIEEIVPTSMIFTELVLVMRYNRDLKDAVFRILRPPFY